MRVGHRRSTCPTRDPGEVVDIDVTIAVEGHAITQARAVCHVADREILTVNAALGDRDFEASGQWESMPADLPAPMSLPQRPTSPENAGTITSQLDQRMVKGVEWDQLATDQSTAVQGRWPDTDVGAYPGGDR